MDRYRISNSIGIKPELFGFGKENNHRKHEQVGITFNSGSTASIEAGKKSFYFVKSGKKKDGDEGVSFFGFRNSSEISKHLVESEVDNDVRKKDWSPEDDGIDRSIEGISDDPSKRVRDWESLPVFEEILARERT